MKNVQEQCFQEVEELKAALFSERSLKAELTQELDLREKRLQQTTVEIQALTSLKTGLEGSLQTSNTRALDDKAEYEREFSLKKEEMDKLCTKLTELEKELEKKIDRVHALEQERDQVRDAYEQMLVDVRNELGRSKFLLLLNPKVFLKNKKKNIHDTNQLFNLVKIVKQAVFVVTHKRNSK